MELQRYECKRQETKKWMKEQRIDVLMLQETKVLSNSGMPRAVLDRVRGVVANCRECRAWAFAGKRTIASTSLPTRFSEIAEGDLLFYKSAVILHLIDRCTRWRAAKVVESKSEQELLNAIHSIWIAIFGPMSTLYLPQGQPRPCRQRQLEADMGRQGH